MLKIWEKIDKFYLLYTLVLLVMAFITIHTFRVIFGSLIDMNVVVTDSSIENTRINQSLLNEAYESIFNKKPTKLLLK